MSQKISCGVIVYNSKTYEVLWEPETKLVWVKDDTGYTSNSGDAKAVTKDVAIEAARKMMELSGAY